jgi:hypothetical protein
MNSIIPNLMLIVVEINTTNTSTTLFNLIVKGSYRKNPCVNEPRRDRIVKRYRLINAISDILGLDTPTKELSRRSQQLHQLYIEVVIHRSKEMDTVPHQRRVIQFVCPGSIEAGNIRKPAHHKIMHVILDFAIGIVIENIYWKKECLLRRRFPNKFIYLGFGGCLHNVLGII